MIKEVNLLLKQYLITKLGNLSDTELDISFTLPNKDWLNNNHSSENWINIYLLEIKENLNLRENTWTKERSSTESIKTKPPLYIDLYYIITFYNKNKNSELENSNLEATLLYLYDFHNLSSKQNDLDENILNEIKLELFPKPFIDENVSYQLWSALDQDARPYIPLKISIPLYSTVSASEGIVSDKDDAIMISVKNLREGEKT